MPTMVWTTSSVATSRDRPSSDVLYDLAEARAGYFTTRQAHKLGVSRQQLYHLARTGSIVRVARPPWSYTA